jgi:hypothetical protein
VLLLALGTLTGSLFARFRMREAEARRLEEDRLIELKLAKLPAIASLLDVAEQQVQAGALADARTSLGNAEVRLREFRGLEGRDSRVAHLQGRYSTIDGQRGNRVEQGGIAEVQAAMGDAKGLEAMLEARKRLLQVPQRSPRGEAVLAELQERLESVSRPSAALGKHKTVLLAKLAKVPASMERDGIPLRHLSGAVGVVQFKGDTCSGAGVVAMPPSGSIPDASATAFVELMAGTMKAPLLWKAPGQSGRKNLSRTVNGLTLREGWFDGRLTELSVGDFQP